MIKFELFDGFLSRWKQFCHNNSDWDYLFGSKMSMKRWFKYDSTWIFSLSQFNLLSLLICFNFDYLLSIKLICVNFKKTTWNKEFRSFVTNKSENVWLRDVFFNMSPIPARDCQGSKFSICYLNDWMWKQLTSLVIRSSSLVQHSDVPLLALLNYSLGFKWTACFLGVQYSGLIWRVLA